MPRGSKPGERRGGRQKGTRNKRKSLRQQAIEQTGVTPLEFMLDVMRNASNPPSMRLDAAKSAAHYVHARLQSVTLTGDGENPLVHSMDLSSLSDAELERLAGRAGMPDLLDAWRVRAIGAGSEMLQRNYRGKANPVASASERHRRI